MIEEHRVDENDDRAGLLAGHHREGAVDVGGTTRLQGLKPQAQGPGCILRVLHLWRVARVGRIPEEGHPGDFGNDVLEYLQLLPDQLGRHQGQPGEVPAGPRDNRDEPARDRINSPRHDDGDRAGRSLCSLARRRTIRHDDVHLETDQLGREAGKPVVVPLRPSGLNRDVLTFHIAQLAQAFPEGREATCIRGGGRRQKTYSGDLPRWRLGCERRGQEAAGGRQDESPPVDHSIT